MKIEINRNYDETQSAIITIDTKTCIYPYAIRNAIELALKLDGFSKETIQEIFNMIPDMTSNIITKKKED